MGPNASISYLEQGRGIPVEELTHAYPALGEHLGRNAGQVTMRIDGFAPLALLAAVEGMRRIWRWAGNPMWGLVVVPIALGILCLPGGELDFDNLGESSIVALTLVG